jgi:uncharacterized OB-fold protein
MSPLIKQYALKNPHLPRSGLLEQAVEADAKKCNWCGRVMYEATFCPKCNIIGSARTA